MLEPSSCRVMGSCAPSTPAAQGHRAGQAESKRQQGLLFGNCGGEGGWGWGTLACALSPAAAGTELLAGASGLCSARGHRSTRGSPGTYRPLSTPPHPSPSKGRDAQALLSAGLSPRAVASSLKEGRSLGLGAQQRCISLARREGQPSGCGSFVFPDCRPGVKAKSKGPLGRGMILSPGCKEGSISPRVLEQPSPARPAPCQERGDCHTARLAPSTTRKGNRLQYQGQHKVLHIPARTSSSASGA